MKKEHAEPDCADCAACSASLACVAGNVHSGYWCRECGKLFVRVGKLIEKKDKKAFGFFYPTTGGDMLVPWKLRYYCKYGQRAFDETLRQTMGISVNPYGVYNPVLGAHDICRDCFIRHKCEDNASAPNSPKGPQLLMTRELYEDLVQNLSSLTPKEVTSPLSPLPDKRTGIPSCSIMGINVLATSWMNRDEILVVGSGGAGSMLLKNVGAPKTLPSMEQLNEIVNTSRELDGRRKQATEMAMGKHDSFVPAGRIASSLFSAEADYLEKKVRVALGVAKEDE